MTQVSHAATVLPVRDIEASLAFYCDQLGFTATFRWQDPPTYIVMNRDEAVHIHLVKLEDEDPDRTESNTLIYIFVYDVDAIHEELLARGVAIDDPIGDRDYGMRDFDVLDPDGHRLIFAAGTKS